MVNSHLADSPQHRLSRRAFLGTAAGALVSGTAGLNVLGTPSIASELKQEQKRAILLFLTGGASQFETWDPKPARPTGGPFLSIPTTVPGYRISELMPAMARRLSRHTAVIRSLDLENAEHGARRFLLGSVNGSRPVDGPAKYPTLGAVLARELARSDSSLLDHIALRATKGIGTPVGPHRNPVIRNPACEPE